jgi:hypothetical protein
MEENEAWKKFQEITLTDLNSDEIVESHNTKGEF